MESADSVPELVPPGVDGASVELWEEDVPVVVGVELGLITVIPGPFVDTVFELAEFEFPFEDVEGAHVLATRQDPLVLLVKSDEESSFFLFLQATNETTKSPASNITDNLFKSCFISLRPIHRYRV